MTKGRQWGKGKKKKKVKTDEITKLWERKTERETDCCNRSICLCTSMQISRLMGEVSVIHTVYTCQVESGDRWLGFWERNILQRHESSSYSLRDELLQEDETEWEKNVMKTRVIKIEEEKKKMFKQNEQGKVESERLRENWKRIKL